MVLLSIGAGQLLLPAMANSTLATEGSCASSDPFAPSTSSDSASRNSAAVCVSAGEAGSDEDEDLEDEDRLKDKLKV